VAPGLLTAPAALPTHVPEWLLAFETATRVMSVAVLRRGQVVAEISTCDARVHSARLLPAVEQVLGLASVGLEEIGAFALSNGPGSFTGLRIGLATVKGLALGDARPVAAVSTLAALAGGAAGAPGCVAALLDARRGEAYAGVWGPGGLADEPQIAEGVFLPEELAARLPDGCRLVVGEGAAPFATRLEAIQPGRWSWVDGVAAEARASRVGCLALALLARGQGQRSEDLVPRYLRRAEAEVQRTGQRFE